VCLLASHLMADNYRQLLEAAKHKSKREVEQQVAALRTLAAVPSSIRKLPQPRPQVPPMRVSAEEHDDPIPRAVPDRAKSLPVSVPTVSPSAVRAVAPERYRIQLTIDRQTHDKLRKVQDLLRHVVPNGDPAVIFDRALSLLLQDLERRKLAQVNRPREGSAAYGHGRHVRAAVRHRVWARDGGQCAFVGAEGRCMERGFLEFHHIMPFAEGGATTADNLELRWALCRYRHKTHYAD
jgi:hypothetical protein